MKKIRNRIYFYKMLLLEIVETLCTICLFLSREGMSKRNPQSMNMQSHFDSLKYLSNSLRNDIERTHEKVSK